MSKKFSAVVVGANGYSGEELVRILLRHPSVRLASVTSRQHAGKPLEAVFPKFSGWPGAELVFTASEAEELAKLDADFFFLALPHGVAAEFAMALLASGKRVIDISADFRLRDAAVYEEFYGQKHAAPELLRKAVYGLPEFYENEIKHAHLVAAPGCYPTSILLPLLPLLHAGLLETTGICVSSASGTSGAGRKADETLLYAECNESLRAYGLPKHRHLSEIEQELSKAAGEQVRITFVPHLAPMTRCIHSTIFARPRPGVSAECLLSTWEKAYDNANFVRVRTSPPDVKHVAFTNFCDIALSGDPRTGFLVLLSAVDNLIKGAGGQGVQCMNLMAGLPQTEGLL